MNSSVKWSIAKCTDKNILKRSVSKWQLVSLFEMKWFVLGTKHFHIQCDSFHIENKTSLFGNEKFGSIIFHWQKVCFHCQSKSNHIVNENVSFPKRIVPFQKGQLVAFSETERFRIFLSVYSGFLRVDKHDRNPDIKKS